MPRLQVRDLDIHYLQRGEAPIEVLALHPATVSGMELTWLHPLLSGLGFSAIYPDMRGHGQTSGPAEDLHHRILVEDMLAFVSAARLAPLHGIGYSMGAGVLLGLALRSPDLFKSLVLLGSNWRELQPGRAERVAGPIEQRGPLARLVFDSGRGFVQPWGLSLESLRLLKMPVLIILGDRDELIDLEDNLAMYRALPNAEFQVTPRAGHFGLVKHPQVFDGIERFYRRIGSQGA